MKHYSVFLLLTFLSLGQLSAQNAVFSLSVVNSGNTSTVSIFARATAATGNNLLGFASYLYYDNTKATVTGFNSTPITGAPYNWGTANQTTTTAAANPNIPISNTGAFFYQNLDDNFVGINLPTTPVLLLTVTLNIISGNGGYVYLGQSNQVPGLAYTDTNFDSYDVIVEGANGIVVPVKLTHFQAEAKGMDALLTWETATEQNLSHYDIERSTDQRHWQWVGQSNGQSNTYTSALYHWTDANALRNAGGEYLYYRLKMVDTDGSFEYSPIRSVQVSKSGQIVRIQPNPVSETLHIYLPDMDRDAAVTATLYDFTGKLVLQMSCDASTVMDVSTLPQGMYTLQLTERNTILATERVAVQ